MAEPDGGVGSLDSSLDATKPRVVVPNPRTIYYEINREKHREEEHNNRAEGRNHHEDNFYKEDC
jgi:hypothetical protein